MAAIGAGGRVVAFEPCQSAGFEADEPFDEHPGWFAGIGHEDYFPGGGLPGTGTEALDEQPIARLERGGHASAGNRPALEAPKPGDGVR